MAPYLLQFDAHTDTWNDEGGEDRIDHGTMFYAVKQGLIEPAQSAQVGIRTKNADTSINGDANEVHREGPEAAAKDQADRWRSPGLSRFDIDGLDPAYAPGTGTPVIGGLTPYQAMTMLRQIAGINLVGMDVVEVARRMTPRASPHWPVRPLPLSFVLIRLPAYRSFVRKPRPMLSNSAKELWELDRKHHLHPWQHFASFPGGRPDRPGGGLLHLRGRRVSATSMRWVASGVPRSARAAKMADAIADQVMKLAYSNPFTDMGNTPSAGGGPACGLAPGDLNHMMFTLAAQINDTAYRLIQFYQRSRGMPTKRHILSRKGSYHGTTYLRFHCRQGG